VTDQIEATAVPEDIDPRHLKELADAELISLAATEPAAFGELYERYVDRIYSYIYHRVGNALDSEDLTARTFQRALQHIGRYVDRGAPFSAWLYRIAHNLVANWHRDQGRRKIIAIDDLVLPAPGRSDPHRKAIAGEDVEEVRQAVRRLSQDRQALLVLKHSEHLSNAEIAEILGRTEGAIKSLYRRTLISLRRIIENHE